MPFSIYRSDIRQVSADAVVLPSNSALQINGGAAYAVATIAGLQQLQESCNKLGICSVGSSVATPAFGFPAKHLIHTVGPAWDNSDTCKIKLVEAYQSALDLSFELQANSVAMPLISAGVRGCPESTSLHIALSVVKDFLDLHPDMQIDLVLFSDKATKAGRSLYPQLAEFIDSETYQLYAASDRRPRFSNAASVQPCPSAEPAPQAAQKMGLFSSIPLFSNGQEKQRYKEKDISFESSTCENAAHFAIEEDAYTPQETFDFAFAEVASLSDFLDELDEPFSTTLLELIDRRGLTDAAVYHRANMSRQHFSKIRSNPNYQPTKKTVLALSVALELSLQETSDLLERAGFAFSPASKADAIVKWFIQEGDYDIFAINEALYSFVQPLLG